MSGPIPQIFVCHLNCSSNWISSISRLYLAVVVDRFQEYTHTATDRPTRGRLVKLGIEENSRRGKGVTSSMLPSLPPRPEEISPEAVSLESHSGMARPAESSEGHRVSPLTVAAPSSSTTTSTLQDQGGSGVHQDNDSRCLTNLYLASPSRQCLTRLHNRAHMLSDCSPHRNTRTCTGSRTFSQKASERFLNGGGEC